MRLLNLIFLTFVACRSNRVRRVVGGTPTTAYPWMVLLSHEEFFCGGTLYTSSLIITAAHNTIKRTKEWRAYPNIKFRSDAEKPDAVGKKIIKRVNHPAHVDEKEDYDIAVWWMQSDSKDPTSVVLGRAEEFSKDEDVYILGWGTTNIITRIEGRDGTYIPELEDQLQIAGVPLVDDKTCKKRYPKEFVRDIMFCIGQPTGGPAAGVGDSGGPVFRERDNKIILMGVISFAKGCGYKDYKDVNVKISAPEITNFINYYTVHFDPANADENGKSITSIPKYYFNPQPHQTQPKKPSYWTARKRKHDEC